MKVEISSDSKISIENHFKVSAGPGAGKTHWLINHIKNVIANSDRLHKTRKIACITYTNTAVEEIEARLSDVEKNRVEVGTIHSFLYNNLVKPFLFLLKDSNGEELVDLKYLDGHEEHIPRRNNFRKWFTEHWSNKRYDLLNDSKKYQSVIKCLKNLDWKFNDNDELVLELRKNCIGAALEIKFPYSSLSHQEFLAYKKYYWEKGEIHHEDILYFAYRILKENPRVIKFLSNKFPYIFIDEFQDTNPIQTRIVKKLGEKQSIVGVIGDSAQSIYKFQGATREDFLNFNLSGLKEYYISDNRRSTQNIIKFIDKIRNNKLSQNCTREIEGDKVTILVGDKIKASNYLHKLYDNVVVLARNNELVGQLKNNTNKELGNLWDESMSLDSNYRRQKLLHGIVYAVELLGQNRNKDALKKVLKFFKKKDKEGKYVCKDKARKCSINVLEKLYQHKAEKLNKLVIDFYNEIINYTLEKYNIKLCSNLRKGQYYKKFSSQYTYKDLIQALKIKDNMSNIRTIHKAKGAEFKTVLLTIEERDMDYIFNPDIDSDKDDTRIYYVGCSRSIDNLFINVPSLDYDNEITKLCEIKEVENIIRK